MLRPANAQESGALCSRMRWAAPLALLLLAGCIGPAAPSETSPELKFAMPGTEPRLLESCQEIITILPVPRQEATPLPPGFSYVSVDSAGTLVEFVVIAASCGDELDVFMMHSVVPPAEWHDAAAEVQAYLIGMLSLPSGTPWYEANGIPIQALRQVQHEFVEAPAGNAGHFRANHGESTTQLDVAVASPSEEEAGHGWLWHGEGTNVSLLKVQLGPRTMAIGTGAWVPGTQVMAAPAGPPLAGIGVTMSGANYRIQLVAMDGPNPTAAAPR